jgi:hypothetical protein
VISCVAVNLIMCTGGAAPPTVAASPSVDSAQLLRMLELTRRRSAKNRQECWHVFYGDVQVGTIDRRTGNPHDTDPWEWLCGFYPGCDPGQAADGCAETFEEAKAQFEEVWNRLRPYTEPRLTSRCSAGKATSPPGNIGCTRKD